MKKLLLLLPFVFTAQQALAMDAQVEENYKKHYSEQMKPLVVKKLSSDRPDMTAKAIRSEADAYVTKMAECQIKGLSNLPNEYRDQAIVPVAEGGDVANTTRALNQKLKEDIDAGLVTKDDVMVMIQTAQESVQICMNS
ncbi:hypothetical protein [Methylophaga sp. OBS1]|uniref:hypothetical protein n=1 Tax=Methylophaga sp. OBS1 TaxID=2991933 RepID=UPI002257D838|nr:hypothetical protein [Methylophaga sp. OBS1]MCX4193677.1 hypothetical protein [Methylophaga sp. OBS1]